MAETEKEGRPPENKRSRKPAHPVKREINEEMKSFAENTMNELLGWYGYDKVELRDSDSLELGETPPHMSVLKENLLPRMPPSERGDASLDGANSSQSLPRNGVPEPLGRARSSTPSLPVMVPMAPPPLIKPPADEDASVQILCAWCQKVGVKRYSLSMGSELKSFCSEKCFAACRRAYFKRNKAKEDAGLGGKLPQHRCTQDTPRLVFNTHSDVLVCDWCKHIRHTKEYLDFGAGERRLQFCSAKCLNQYKMDIFYKETQAALPAALCAPGHAPAALCAPGHAPAADATLECSGLQLLTPESWGTPLAELRRKAPSPGGPSSCSTLTPSTSSATPPSDAVAVCSPSSSSSVKIPTPRPHESPTLPPPPLPSLHPPVGVPSGSPPMVMTPRGPMPLPLFMEHQMLQQMRPPFLRSSAHPGGPNSPLSNPIIPGIGPPPPPRNMGPASSPMHRSLMSPHVHPSSNPNPGMMPPHPGLPLPGLPPFPPVNMLPNGRIPLPPVMNFGMPSLAPLVPPPTLLVPYPIVVPLPVPIPIPIPIPYSPKDSRDQSQRNGPVRGGPEFHASLEGGGPSPGPPREDRLGALRPERLSPFHLDTDGTPLVDLTVKTEDKSENLCPPTGFRQEGVIDLTVGQRSGQQLLIHRTLPQVQVKVEAEAEASSSPAAGPEGDGNGGGEGLGAQGLLGETGVGGVTVPKSSEPSGPGSSSSSPSPNEESSVKGPDASMSNQPVQTQPQSQTQPQTQPQSQNQPQNQPQVQVQVQVQIQPQNQVQNQPQPQIQPQIQPQNQPQNQPQVQVQPQVQPQNQIQPQVEVQPQVQPQNQIQPQVQVQPRNQIQPQVQVQPQVQPQVQVQPQNQIHPQVQPQNQIQPQPPTQPQTSPAAPCNVIVNGNSWHPLLPPALSSPDHNGDPVSGGGPDQEKAANGDLERDALKENTCSLRDWEQGKRGAVQDGGGVASEEQKELESDLEEGEHAYALPLLSAGGCMVLQPLSKPGGEKTAILSCSISNPISSAGSPELEPPLKRRCLRIRNQNK